MPTITSTVDNQQRQQKTAIAQNHGHGPCSMLEIIQNGRIMQNWCFNANRESQSLAPTTNQPLQLAWWLRLFYAWSESGFMRSLSKEHHLNIGPMPNKLDATVQCVPNIMIVNFRIDSDQKVKTNKKQARFLTNHCLWFFKMTTKQAAELTKCQNIS